jgi:hypothetical protein
MQDYNVETSAFVGVAFSSEVIYNYVQQEGEFNSTGASIIEFLREDKNKFVAKLIESQSYECIKLLFDDDMIFDKMYDKTNTNNEPFKYIYEYMEDGDLFEYFYIYDFLNDVLIVKTPYSKPIALDYKSDEDVEYFIQSLL